MKNTKRTRDDTDRYVFRAQDFYALLEKQEYKCALTGRTLTPENTSAEHIVPIRRGGKHELANIFLVDDAIAKLKRYATVEEIFTLAREIVANEKKGEPYSAG
jgi:hypothetical protein